MLKLVYLFCFSYKNAICNSKKKHLRFWIFLRKEGLLTESILCFVKVSVLGNLNSKFVEVLSCNIKEVFLNYNILLVSKKLILLLLCNFAALKYVKRLMLDCQTLLQRNVNTGWHWQLSNYKQQLSKHLRQLKKHPFLMCKKYTIEVFVYLFLLFLLNLLMLKKKKTF